MDQVGKGWSKGPEQIAVICKEVKGMGKSGRRAERKFGSRERVWGRKMPTLSLPPQNCTGGLRDISNVNLVESVIN